MENKIANAFDERLISRSDPLPQQTLANGNNLLFKLFAVKLHQHDYAMLSFLTYKIHPFALRERYQVVVPKGISLLASGPSQTVPGQVTTSSV